MKKDKGRKKWLLPAAAAVLVSGISVGSTYAFLKQPTEDKTNPFRPGIVNIAIDENGFEDGTNMPEDGTPVEKAVTIKNTAEGKPDLDGRIVPVYIRVALVAQWKDEEKNLLPIDQNSVEFQLADSSDWKRGDDGYYYYTKVVQPEEDTEKLLESVSVNPAYKENIPEGAKLEVEVLADAVQATKQARLDAWGEVKAEGKVLSFQEK